ncbi:hypothetical protein Tdes44962_MAKER10252 [Teratosphaeria destructans]|uniref:Secreted protein n=1 Tax=Teratosphaeria destructans TaxID=418781 RepID=A0A9W7VZT4_9PEZI|nr:hypothetical protein Tdes44962_MAKER10252 [Teratosphaeria destructans]
MLVRMRRISRALRISMMLGMTFLRMTFQEMTTPKKTKRTPQKKARMEPRQSAQSAAWPLVSAACICEQAGSSRATRHPNRERATPQLGPRENPSQSPPKLWNRGGTIHRHPMNPMLITQIIYNVPSTSPQPPS